MENIISFVNRYIKIWLDFESAFLDTDPNYIFLCGVGFILLYLWYLILKPFLPPPWKNQDIKKVRMYGEPHKISLIGMLQCQMSYYMSLAVCQSPT